MFAVNITQPKSFYNPGQKSLGQYYNMHIFLSFLGSLIKTVHPFQNFLSVLPSPNPIQSWNLEKILHTCVQHCLWREGRVGPVWIEKRPINAKVSQDFCPWLKYFLAFPLANPSFNYPLALSPFSLYPLPTRICTYTPCLFFLKLNDGLHSTSIGMTWQGTDNGLSFTYPESSNDTSQPFGEGNNNIINPLSPNVHI